MVILNNKGEQRKYHEGVVIIPERFNPFLNDVVTINKATYVQLQADADHLNQLKNAGVDNWSEYFSYQEDEDE